MGQQELIGNLAPAISQAVASYWQARNAQQARQRQEGRSDQGTRGAVTGGAQMDGFIDLLSTLAVSAGVEETCIFRHRALELPGFFRPTKEWDLLVVRHDRLLLALEAKSQVGPSFGNNFNNRTEEAMGSALDLWTAFREGALGNGAQPFLGYLFLLEDCPAAVRPVGVREPHFDVLPEFRGSSYMKRYELFCQKLVRERHYTAAAFLTSTSASGLDGVYCEPAEDLTVATFAKAMVAHLRIQCELG